MVNITLFFYLILFIFTFASIIRYVSIFRSIFFTTFDSSTFDLIGAVHGLSWIGENFWTNPKV